MKQLLIASLLLAAAPAMAATDVGFESGDTSGWTVTGNADASTGYGAFTPYKGGFFGLVVAGAAEEYSKLTKTVALAAGEKLAGVVGFQAGDYLPYDDDAYLSVNGVNIFTSSVAAVGDFGNTGWQKWSYVAPVDGSYTIELGVRNRFDSGFSSAAMLDAVPEPAQWALMIAGFGMVGLASRGRRAIVSA